MTFARQYGEARADEIAICDERVALSWLELDEVLNRVCNALLATDLGDQHRIAVFAENGVETAFANMGGLIAGASVVPVNFHLTAEGAENRQGIFMIDASRGFVKDGNKNRLRAQDIHKIVDVFYKQTELCAIPAWCP